MQWLIVKQKESLSEYSYATYIYNLIAEDFLSRGSTIIELIDEEKFLPHESQQNVLYVLNGPDTKEALMRLWYAVSLPKIVKKLKVEKIIYLNGLIGPYKLIRQPQIMLLYGTDYFVNPKIANKWQQLSFKRIAQNVERSTFSFTYSQAAINTLSKVLSEHLSCKIKMLQPTPRSIFSKISCKEKQDAKNIFSQGDEYYLLKTSSNDIDEIVHFLKAFSYFKKWQITSMKLVMLVSEKITENITFKEIISSYAFRNDVLFLGEMNRTDYHLLLGAAYGFLMLSSRDSDLPYILEALQCGTPVLTFDSPSVKEVADDAPYYLIGKTSNDIGQGMIALYKSERMRDTHIEKGLDIAVKFNFDATKNQLLGWLNHT